MQPVFKKERKKKYAQEQNIAIFKILHRTNHFITDPRWSEHHDQTTDIEHLVYQIKGEQLIWSKSLRIRILFPLSLKTIRLKNHSETFAVDTSRRWYTLLYELLSRISDLCYAGCCTSQNSPLGLKYLYTSGSQILPDDKRWYSLTDES